ncbi:hypothetical protein LguiB_021491 [Lonicera macranthoides]
MRGPATAWDACQLFDEMPERTVVDSNLMISGYWNWGNEVEARGLFHMIPKRNAITSNAMEAVELFNEMMNASVQPDKTFWVAGISSFSSHGDPCLAESLVKRCDNKGISMNCFVNMALHDYYAKYGSLEIASKNVQKLLTKSGAVMKGFGRLLRKYSPVLNWSALENHDLNTSHVTIEHRNIEMDGYVEHGRVGDASDDLESVMGHALDLRGAMVQAKGEEEGGEGKTRTDDRNLANNTC